MRNNLSGPTKQSIAERVSLFGEFVVRGPTVLYYN